ncbi:hypothetical protein DFH28DRAFT_1133437 [Melampsora americana]|nr:hypothetical protein DFH28DRAFT_1133437 [Melampsora americana]
MTNNSSERIDEFLKSFHQEIKNYQLSPNLNQLNLIKSNLNQIANELPSYHLKNCIDQLSNLSNPIEKESKRKFKFKGNLNKLIHPEEENPSDQIEIEIKKEGLVNSTDDFRISNQHEIYFKPTDEHIQSISIEGIEKSILDLRNLKNLKLMFIEDLKNCILIYDEIHLNGSIKILHSFHSIFIFSSNQIRVHDSKNLLFWVQSNTIPIIERCENLIFNSKNQNQPIKEILDFNQPIFIQNQIKNFQLNLNSSSSFNEILNFINQFDPSLQEKHQFNLIENFIQDSLST